MNELLILLNDPPNRSERSYNLLDGHQRKLTLDWTRVDQDDAPGDAPAARDRNLFTVQVAVGF